MAEKAAKDRTGGIVDLPARVAQEMRDMLVLCRVAGRAQEPDNPFDTVLGGRFAQQRPQVIAGGAAQSPARAIVVRAARVVQRAYYEKGDVHALNVRATRYHALQALVEQFNKRNILDITRGKLGALR